MSDARDEPASAGEDPPPGTSGVRAGGGESPAGRSFGPLYELTRARVVEFLRQPEAIFWVFGFPVVMAVVLGLAFRSQPAEEIPVAVAAETADAAELARGLDASPRLSARTMAAAEAAQALRTGKVELVIRREGGGGALVYRLDPARPTSRAARLEVDHAAQQAAGRRDVVAVRDEPVSEPGARYIDFLIPGLIGLNLMGSGMWGIGFAVVMMRTSKLLRRFAATPMRRGDFLLSLMLSRLIFLTLELVLLVAFGWIAFDVAVHGSLLDLVAVALLASLAFTGLALLTAARAKTVETASGIMNLVMVPMWLMSGSFFSYERFPDWLQPAIRALPLTAVNDALRLVMNEGRPLADAWLELVILAGWTALTFAVALKIFRWR
jgi:ABC-type multidrug transport system permease subunit